MTTNTGMQDFIKLSTRATNQHFNHIDIDQNQEIKTSNLQILHFCIKMCNLNYFEMLDIHEALKNTKT